MFALRRAVISARNRGFHSRAAWIYYSQFDTSDSGPQNASALQRLLYPADGSCPLPGSLGGASSISAKSSWNHRLLSTSAGAKASDGEDEKEHGFSELDEASESDAAGEIDNKEDGGSGLELESGSDEESSDNAAEELDFTVTDADADSKEESGNNSVAALIAALLRAPRTEPIGPVLDKFVEDGHEIDRAAVSAAILSLRRRRLYHKAFQLSEWVQAKKVFDFTERDYACHLSLMAKEHGLYKAEIYISAIPEVFRTEVVYRTLLANCVSATNVSKAEKVFNKMKSLGFPLSAFACNQLLLLYKRTDKKKIADVLMMMEKENVKPTLFTYRVLIDVKGRSNDIEGMEQTLEHMMASEIVPDLFLQAVIARHYIYAGATDKAETILKQMEGKDLKGNRAACKSVIPLYAALGKEDEVARVWRNCEENPRLDECIAAIEAWGKLGHIDRAETVFEQMKKKWRKLSEKYYIALLKVYTNNKDLIKGKELVRRMSSDGCATGPMTWDGLVKLYLAVGEVEKADAVLQKAVLQSPNRQPLYSSYISILDKYAKRGDIASSEKIFQKMRKSGYVGRLRMFQSLLDAYIMAKTPAYGFRERMKADNIFPNNTVAGQLNTIDSFQSETLHLLD